MYPSASIAIIGRAPDTVNYENALRFLGADVITSLDPEQCEKCDGLLLPGGGDITPAFFGQLNHGSRNIDTELDIIQLRALDFFVKCKKPVLGTICQHLENAGKHEWKGKDQFHYVYHIGCSRRDFFYQLYGNSSFVNSAHHQSVDRLGKGLTPVCQSYDGIIEAVSHDTLPIMAVQWHPERIMDKGGEEILTYFLSRRF